MAIAVAGDGRTDGRTKLAWRQFFSPMWFRLPWSHYRLLTISPSPAPFLSLSASEVHLCDTFLAALPLNPLRSCLIWTDGHTLLARLDPTTSLLAIVKLGVAHKHWSPPFASSPRSPSAARQTQLATACDSFGRASSDGGLLVGGRTLVRPPAASIGPTLRMLGGRLQSWLVLSGLRIIVYIGHKRGKCIKSLSPKIHPRINKSWLAGTRAAFSSA